MAAPKCTEEEFISLCLRLKSASDVSRKLNVTERNVHARRRYIETKRGIKLPFTSGPIDRRVKDLGYDDTDWTVAWDKTDGLSVLVHNPNFTPDTYHSALNDAIATVRKLSPKFPRSNSKR